MQLDQTQIVIRERSLLDILDMSLRVLVLFGGQLMVCFATVIIPLMALNWWLLGWMLETGEEEFGFLRYVTAMICMVTIQSPLISLLVTPLLGSAMFLQTSVPRQIVKSLRQSWFPVAVSQLLFRGVLFSFVIAWMIPRTDSYTGWEVWLILLTLGTLILRATRPFINEIILLERNPLRSKERQAITIGRRNSTLHSPNASDLIGRWLAGSLVAVILVLSLLGTMWFSWGMLLFDWNWGPVMWHICFPLSLWTVAAYFSVVRFLSYLDLRIRREGWEVELMIRAAAAQLAGVNG